MSEMIPHGFYNAVAVPVDTDNGRVWAQFGEAKNGTKQVVVTFEILDGPQVGRRLSWFGYFAQKSVDRTIESLRFAGFKGDDLSQLPFQQLDQKVSITVEHDTWEGKTRAKIAWVNRPGGGGVKLAKPLDQGGLRMFAASLKTRVAAKAEVAAEKGVPGASSTPEPEPAPPVDDVPF